MKMMKKRKDYLMHDEDMHDGLHKFIFNILEMKVGTYGAMTSTGWFFYNLDYFKQNRNYDRNKGEICEEDE